MNKDLLNYFTKKLNTALPVFFILVVLFLSPDQALSQRIQLTASDKVVKVALIDHSRLRKEFKKFDAAKEKISKENKAEKKSLDEALRLLDEQTKDQLAQDSLNGGSGRDQIISQANVKRTGIINSNQSNQKKMNQDREALMQEYELKINLAIDSVVAEGGFTEVKPLTKDLPVQRSVDITDLLLKKLN